MMAELEKEQNINNIGTEDNCKSFKYADALEDCDEAIEKFMGKPDGVYFRLVHNPLHPNDDIPQPLQKWDGLTQDRVPLSTKVPKGSPVEVQWEQVRNYSPSYNISDEKLAGYFLNMLDRRKTEKQKQKLLEKKEIQLSLLD